MKTALRNFAAVAFILCGSVFFLSRPLMAEETVVESVSLPGASLNQEITYFPSRQAYQDARQATLKRLRAGDMSAMVNPASGPWMRVETTATIGIEYRGVGVSSGRKNVRQVSAAEEALYRLQKEKR